MEAAGARGAVPIKLIAAFVALAFVAGGISGAVVTSVMSDDGSGTTAAPGIATETRVLSSEETAVSEAIEKAVPGVVTVINEGPQQRDAQGRTFETVASGSGIIVDDRGFILTNEHVVRNPGTLTVVLHSGEELRATLITDDAPFNDLALLRIPAGNWKALTLAEAETIKLGQTVIAIGSPLYEFHNSVSLGIVSGLGRRYLRDNVFLEDLIQTDAAINQGNSGGPLVNTRGEVVGVVTNVVRRIAEEDTVYGISFAVSAGRLAPIVKSMVERGQYPRPYFGIDHVDLDEGLAQLNNLRSDRGALVRRVIEGSPAQAAGLRSGDIILKLGAMELNPDTPYINALARIQPNERVSIEFSRNGQVQQATVQVVPR